MDFIKIYFSLNQCHNRTLYSDDGGDADLRTTDDNDKGRESESGAGPALESSFIKEVLGVDLYGSVKELFSVPVDDSDDGGVDDSEMTEGTSDTCSSLATLEFHLTKNYIDALLVTALLLMIAFLWIVIHRKCSASKTKTNKPESTPVPKENIIKAANVTPVAATSMRSLTEIFPKPEPESKSNEMKTVKFIYQAVCTKKTLDIQVDLSRFLDETTHRLFSKLDRLLLKNPAGMDQTQSAIATPRLARRTLVRRQRVGSSPMLQYPEASTSENFNKDSDKNGSWDLFKQLSLYCGLVVQKTLSVNQDGLDRNNKKLVQYFQRVCPVDRDTWKATCLTVNYVMFLVQSELQNLCDVKSAYQFVRFEPCNWLKLGTSVSRLNTFEFLVHLRQNIPVKEVLYELGEASKMKIVPGQVILILDKNSQVESKYKTHLKVDSERFECLSSKQFLADVREMLDQCLHSLYSQTSSGMDRLPFQIRRAPVDGLQLVVNTRALVGLGETELKINLVPVLPVITEGQFHSPLLYLTPIPNSYDNNNKVDPRSISHPDHQWQLRYDAFDLDYRSAIDRYMAAANVHSCYYTLLMILKALLTGCSKNSLLDRGVLPAGHIVTVLDFMLLESVPEQWTYDKLTDRFSDAIHFIRESYRNDRLPNFFFANPHLKKKMPVVSTSAILGVRKQHNLLKDWTEESLNKCLEYMKDRLKEVGLTDCVKEEYSHDMWEYEFFLFN